MALSRSSVGTAYKVLNELNKTVLPELQIPSYPKDLNDMSDDEQENPTLLQVYGWDRKSDDGWESLVFFLEKPTEEVKKTFLELAKQVGNSAICKPYSRNKNIWIIGWF